MNRIKTNKTTPTGLLVLALLMTGCAQDVVRTDSSDTTDVHEARVIVERYVVQGSSADQAAAEVTAVGGVVTHELGVIRAVGAELDAAQLAKLRAADETLRVYRDQAVTLNAYLMTNLGGTDSAPRQKKTEYVDPVGDAPHMLTNAKSLHANWIDGWGVGIAVLDTGAAVMPGLTTNSWRTVTRYNAITGQLYDDSTIQLAGDDDYINSGEFRDGVGHGTHVAAIATADYAEEAHGFYGIAPSSDLIAVSAFDANGYGSYLDVISGIDWIVKNKDQYNIRVLNLSLGAEVRSHYWDDPLNQAVMAAWHAGIVVVASAGNLGPDPMTVGVPGNVPYVITVGAMTDNYTPYDGSDDVLATFSSAGPTYEGFVKPEIVAPGGHIESLMPENASIRVKYTQYQDGPKLFSMSGTSQATAVVSGIVALMLQMEPDLTPDQVKYRLMATARPATDDNGMLAYSVFQQGAGMVNAYEAVLGYDGDPQAAANRGMYVKYDLAGYQHYGGRANQDANGDFYIMDLDGYTWTDGYIWTDGYVWTDGFVWTDGYVWTDGFVWTDSYVWTDGFVWTDGYVWTDSLDETAAVNSWVEQE